MVSLEEFYSPSCLECEFSEVELPLSRFLRTSPVSGSANFAITEISEVHIKILIPLFTHAHPTLMFACHTAPKP
jgi:hypothetical protein